MRPLAKLVPTMCCIALAIQAGMAADTPGASQNSAGTTTTGAPNANTTKVVSAGEVETQLNAYTSKIDATKAKYLPDSTGSVETIYQNVITANAAEMATKDGAMAATGTTQFKGRTFDLGLGELTLGGQVTDIDTIDSYPQVPEYVHFVTSEKNQLASLDSKMKRASSWLNKHTCGGFDWAAQFGFMFKVSALKEYLTSLGEGVIAAAPMALLGAFSPQLAEIVKHLKLISGMDLSATKADCQAMQAALTSGTQKAMWGDNYSNCLNDNKNSGVANATKICQNQINVSTVPNADGSKSNPNASAATSSGGWLSDGYAASQDWLSTVYPPDPAVVNAALGQSAASTGQGAAEAQSSTGMQNALVNPSTARYLGAGMSSASKDLADTLFGSIKIHSTGSLELGKKSYELFSLKMKTHSAILYSHLMDNFAQHYDLMMNPDTDGETLSESYQGLKLCTYRVRGSAANVQPWRDTNYPRDPLHTDEATLSQWIDDHTMDSIAYLLNRSAYYKGNASIWADQENTYTIEAFVIAMAKYECFLHTYKELREKKEIMVKYIDGNAANGQTFPMNDKAIAQFDRAIHDMDNDVSRLENEVLVHLKAINDFRVPRPSSQYDDNPGSGIAPARAVVNGTP